mmetsp:Transcript_35196/g.48083  ORF Transcript_35196/g.48083 Transcript_35196/m.48083 type:complete len:608 (+) Transcript_35196:119-1942(+)
MSSPQISDKKEEAGGILKKSSKEEKEEKDKKQVGFAPGSAPVIEVDGGHSPVVKKNFMVDMKRLSKSHYQIRPSSSKGLSEKSNIEQAFEIIRKLETNSSPKEQQDLAFIRSIFITLLRQDQQSFLPSYLMDDMPSVAPNSPGVAPPPAVVKSWLRSNFSQAQDTENTVIVRQAVSAFKGLLSARNVLEETIFDYKSLPPEMLKVLEERDSWDFNIFSLKSAADGDMKLAGVALIHKIFDDWNFFKTFRVKSFRLRRFVEVIIDHYRDNPYHNSTHILDVTQTLHVMLKAGLSAWLTDQQRLALIVAGIVHDVEHDGLSNIYHVKTFSTRALAHNDVSPQENHHLVTAFTLMKRREFSIFSELNPSDFSLVRGVMIRSVLFSDMSQHFKLLENLKTLTDEKGIVPSEEYEAKDIELICSLALHAADISNPAKQFPLAKAWTQRVMTEFMDQGDLERERKFQISPMCDRFQPAVPDSQCGFIKYVVRPTFSFLNKLVPGLEAPITHLDANFAIWDDLRSKSNDELEEMDVMPLNYKATTAALKEKLDVAKKAKENEKEEGKSGDDKQPKQIERTKSDEEVDEKKKKKKAKAKKFATLDKPLSTPGEEK